MSSILRPMAALTALSLLLTLPLSAAPPKAPDAPVKESTPTYLQQDVSPAAAHRSETRAVEDLFGRRPTQRIDLMGAIEMALKNNLDVKFDKLGIALQRAELKFARGAFDPVLGFNGQYQSVRRPQDLNNPSTTTQILQQQGLQEQLNNAAISNFNIEQQAFQSQVAAQQNLTAINQQAILSGANPSTLPNAIAAPTAPTLVPITNPAINNIVILNQSGSNANLSLSGKTPIGTRYALQITADQQRNTFSGDLTPVHSIYDDSIGLQIQQPLLKGFGTAANLADVRAARVSAKVQTLTWKNNISNSVQGVIAAYYDMTFALDGMRVQEEAIAADSRLVELYQRRVDLGFGSPFDIRQAEVQVSTDREALLISKNNFLERQFALKRLILSKFDVGDARLFFPDRIQNLRVPTLDRSALLASAFEHRYDYRGTILNAEVLNIRLRFAKNQLLPELDLVGTYGLNGLGTNFSSGVDDTFQANHPQYSVGFQFQLPIGNRQARAQYEAVIVQREQAILRIKQAELGVGIDVDTAISRIETNRQRMEAARKTRELGDEAVRIAFRRLEEGQISAYDITEQQRRLYDAKARELATLADLNKSISVLWLATGTVLQQENIGFKEPTDLYTPPAQPSPVPPPPVTAGKKAARR